MLHKRRRCEWLNYWKISDFAKEVGKHTNTVDGWFKQLEEKQLHAVNRTEHAEKVYDQVDLEIALYIKEKRDQKWALDAIFHELPKHFELRPILDDLSTTRAPQVVDPELLKKEFEKVAIEIAEKQIKQIRDQYAELLKRLPTPKTIQEERQERVNDIITRRRIETQLEVEAINMWATKPEEERKKRVGIFRKEEDRDKRELFIKNYINEHLEERLKKEYELT